MLKVLAAVVLYSITNFFLFGFAWVISAMSTTRMGIYNTEAATKFAIISIVIFNIAVFLTYIYEFVRNHHTNTG